MRITYIANSIVPSRSANSVHVMRMCSALASNGHKVTLLVPQRPETESTCTSAHEFYGVNENFGIERLKWPGFRGRAYIYAVYAAARARRLKSELVYCRNVHACYLCAVSGIPAIFESHAPISDFDTLGTCMFNHLIRLSKFRRLVVISDALHGYYLQKYPSLTGRVITARDGADVQSGVAAGPLFGKEHSGQLRVGYAGQLYRGKGMEVIEKLCERCPWADFHIMGGMATDIDYWKGRLRGRQNVYLHGFLPPADVGRGIAACDVMLAPYQNNVTGYGRRRELSSWMSPLKIFEYMAARKAMIVSDIPVLREMLDATNAILVRPDDVDQWAAALDSLRENEQLRSRLADQAHEALVTRYTWSIRARRVLQ